MTNAHIDANTNQAKFRKDYKAPNFVVDEVYLEFDLHATQTRVLQIAKYRQIGTESNELWLDGVEQKLLNIKVDNKDFSDYTLSDKGMLLTGLPEQFELFVESEIDPQNNTSLEGLYLSDGAYCTQCEAEGFRKITFFQDRPDVLTKYTVKVIADKSVKYLLSNGNKIESGTVDEVRHYTIWQDPFNKPSYLFALVAGEFDVLHDHYLTQSGRDVKLELFVDIGNLDKAEHAMQSLKRAMKWDEQRFNLEYDLDIYMIVAVDFFNMGAMENKGLNVFNSKCVLASQHSATDRDYHTIESIVGHEYFHNWTGNRVTCQDWFQLSLKEGLTVFRDQEFSSDLGSRTLNRIDAVKAIRGPQFSEDAGPMAHPIRPEKVIEMNNFYTVTVYNKGAEVIRMMHTLLGEESFQKGMDLYFKRHDGTAATCDDFVAAMQDASSVDLSLFSRWYSQYGTPELKVKRSYDAQNQKLTLDVKQVLTHNDKSHSSLHIPIAIEILSPDGQSVPLVRNGKNVSKIISLTSEQQLFEFDHIPENAAVVLLENFSAPCKLSFEQSIDELITIVKYATSDFSKWDAMQSLMSLCIVDAIDSEYVIPSEVLELYRFLINSDIADLSLLSELIALPSFDTIASHYSPIPVDEIVAKLAQIKSQIANQFTNELATRYESLDEQGGLDAHSIGVRALKGRLLDYLAASNWRSSAHVLEAEFVSDNLTSSLNALSAACENATYMHLEMLARFKTKWHDDVLVLDKWLAQTGRLKNGSITEIMSEMFDNGLVDITNPNRVRALVMSFCMFNPKAFHAEDGSGYKLLTDLLIKLDAINPQNAARLITPLLSFERHNERRQQQAKMSLNRLAQLPDLSADLFEKVSNALKQ
jgi:aminopeptidase N